MSCEAAESVEDAIHDNRMFAERAFYCIANACAGCKKCVTKIGCPALTWSEASKRIVVDGYVHG